MSLNLESLWKEIAAPFARHVSVHGPDHWRRVERNGQLLATRTGADADVVRLFALFHDSRRVNDGHDPGHGARGAEFASSYHGKSFQLSDEAFETLRFACIWHTDGVRHDDVTIATCWDADRLDLGRVGIIPDPRRMCTDFGRDIAATGSVEPFLAQLRASKVAIVESTEAGG